MGTRHLTMVVLDGDYKVAQYGQWDGYPSTAGVTILEALLKANKTNFAELRACAENSSFLTDDDIQMRWKAVGADASGFVGMDVSDKFKGRWPHLSRDMGYNIIDHMIKNPQGLELKNDLNFVADSLFCEYAYVVDLDKNTFEVYEGFNQSPLDPSERFFDFFDKTNQDHRDDHYYPVSLRETFSLNDLPNIDTFLNKFKEEGEEDFDDPEDATPQKGMKI